MSKNLIFLLIITLIVACSEKEDLAPDTIKINRGGIFIVNEGNFSFANSSLSYFNPSNSEIQNNLFYKVSNVPLGDVAQSITIHENEVYLVINNSGIVYGVNRETLEFKGKISGLTSPREMIFINDNKAYISDLISTKLTVINPASYEIIGEIELGKSSDCMIKTNNKVMTANWSAYNQTTINNTVMVINSDTDKLVDSVVVGIEPNSMVIDKNNYLWVLCSGGFMNSELPTLWKINTGTLETEKQFTFTNIAQSPDNLCINGNSDSLYFLNNSVFRMSIYDQSLPETAIISEEENNYYSLGIDPINNDIYVSDAIDYNQNGIVYRYNSSGNYISSTGVGIIPGCFGFNY